MREWEREREREMSRRMRERERRGERREWERWEREREERGGSAIADLAPWLLPLFVPSPLCWICSLSSLKQIRLRCDFDLSPTSQISSRASANSSPEMLALLSWARDRALCFAVSLFELAPMRSSFTLAALSSPFSPYRSKELVERVR